MENRYYYDACALEANKDIYKEFLDKNYPHESIVSFLSLGEAYGNCRLKSKEASNAFTQLIEDISDHISIENHDGIEAIFNKVREIFKELDMCDAIHLATAIKYKCCIFKTADRDLYGIPENKVQELAADFGLNSFVITQVKTPFKKKLKKKFSKV